MSLNKENKNITKEHKEVIFLKEGETENIKIFESMLNKNICIQINNK